LKEYDILDEFIDAANEEQGLQKIIEVYDKRIMKYKYKVTWVRQ
jgi:hypothetical protein